MRLKTNMQPDLFGSVEVPKCQHPRLRRYTGDEFQFAVMSNLASLGVRASASPELAPHDTLAIVPVKFTVAGTEILDEQVVRIQSKGKEANIGSYAFGNYREYAFDIAAIGTRNGIYYIAGVPNGTLSISNSQLLNANLSKQSWHNAVNTHLRSLVDTIGHPEFEGLEYAPIF